MGEMDNVRFTVKDTERQSTGVKRKQSFAVRYVIWLYNASMQDIINIHSQLSACQFRLQQNKTKRQALHRGP